MHLAIKETGKYHPYSGHHKPSQNSVTLEEEGVDSRRQLAFSAAETMWLLKREPNTGAQLQA